MPKYQPYQRFSEAEREKVATRLKDAYADGRLDSIEFHERLDGLYKAQTYGELEPIVSDLPAGRTYKTPEVANQTPSVAPGEFAETSNEPGLPVSIPTTLFGVFGIGVVLGTLFGGWVTGGLLLIPWALLGFLALRARNNTQRQLQARKNRELEF